MNLLLLLPGDLGDGGRARLTGRRAEHLRKILKVEVGQRLRAGVLDGPRGEAEILGLSADGVEVRFLSLPGGEAGADVEPWADLILALPRPAVLHRLLQLAATMGLGRLLLVRSWRVEKSYFSSPALRPEAIREHLLLGAEQGLRTRLPEVEIHHRLLPMLEMLGREPANGRRILAQPGAAASLLDLHEPAAGMRPGERAQLAIGPEGGWIEREVESFRELGFTAVDLGPWVLRVESAVAVALGQISLLRGGLGEAARGPGPC